MQRIFQGIGYIVGGLALLASGIAAIAGMSPAWLPAVVAAGIGVAVLFAPSIQDFFRGD